MTSLDNKMLNFQTYSFQKLCHFLAGKSVELLQCKSSSQFFSKKKEEKKKITALDFMSTLRLNESLTKDLVNPVAPRMAKTIAWAT